MDIQIQSQKDSSEQFKFEIQYDKTSKHYQIKSGSIHNNFTQQNLLNFKVSLYTQKNDIQPKKSLQKLIEYLKISNITYNKAQNHILITPPQKLLGGGNKLCCGGKDNTLDGQISVSPRNTEDANKVNAGMDPVDEDSDDDSLFYVMENYESLLAFTDNKDTDIDSLKNIFHQIQEEQEQEQKQEVLGVINARSGVQIFFIVDYSIENRPLFARKVFNKFEPYEVEKLTYDQINKDFQQKNQLRELKTYASLMVDCPKELENTIQFPLGLCTLEQFAKQRQEKNVIWNKNEVLYICYRLLDFVIFMQKNGWYHGDIKPCNIIINKNEKNNEDQYEIQIIDFGGASDHHRSQQQRTPVYFSSFKRVEGLKDEKEINKKVNMIYNTFDSAKERFQAEIYTVLRTIQYIYILSLADSEKRESLIKDVFNLPKIQDQTKGNEIFTQLQTWQSEDRLKKLFDDMKNHMFPSDSQFQHFLKVLSTDFLHEKFQTPEDLQKKFMDDPKIFPPEAKTYGIIDKSQIMKLAVHQIMKNQPVIGPKRFDSCPLELLFLMDSYIADRKCKVFVKGKELDKEQYLGETIDNFLGDKSKNLVLVHGKPGIGKTAFLRHFKTVQAQKNPDQCMLTFTMNKKIVQSQKNYETLIQKLITNVGQTAEFSEKNPMIVMIDACDDIMRCEGSDPDDDLEYVDIMKPFVEEGIKKFKIIVASRLPDLNNFDSLIQKYPDSYLVLQICLFNEDQIRQYIAKYVQQVKQRKNYWNDLLFFENENRYIFELQSNNIMQTAKNPLNLRIILQVLPQIKEESDDILLNNSSSRQKGYQKKKIAEQKIKKQLTEYTFFKAFIKQLFIRKLKPLPYKDLAILLNVQESQINIQNEDQFLIRAVNLLFNFNKQIAMLIFSQNMLPVSVNKLNEIIVKKLGSQLSDKPEIREQQMALLKNCSPIVDINQQYNTNNSHLNSSQQNMKTNYLNQSPGLSIKSRHSYQFEHKFVEEFFLVDCIIQELQSIPSKLNPNNIKNNQLNLQPQYISNFLNQNPGQFANFLLNTKKLRKNEDQQLLALMENYAHSQLSPEYRLLFSNVILKPMMEQKNQPNKSPKLLKNLMHNSEIVFDIMEKSSLDNKIKQSNLTEQILNSNIPADGAKLTSTLFQGKGKKLPGMGNLNSTTIASGLQSANQLKNLLGCDLASLMDLQKSCQYQEKLMEEDQIIEQ